MAPAQDARLSVCRLLGWVGQQLHVGLFEVPEERGVVQPSAACDGLRVAPELALTQNII